MSSYPNKVDDAESGTLTYISSLPALPKFSPSDIYPDSKQSLGKDESPLNYNSFLIPRKSTPPPPTKITNWTKVKLWYNMYRKLFTIVVSLNLVAFVLTLLGIWKYPHASSGALIMGNLSTAILIRNELFQRTLYLIVHLCFNKWPPLWFRLSCTNVLQHLGGIHSGCAISGFVWLIYRVTLIFIDHSNNAHVILGMGVVTSLAVIGSIISAMPWVRNTHHNVFERHHRFIGWSGVIFSWIFVLVGDAYNIGTHTWNLDAMRVLHSQELWFCISMTVFILIPWLCTRRVPVHIEIPSPKVAVIRFERGMQHGLLGRISRSPVWEYHAFGIISEGKHAKYHYLIAGVQGDFTKSLVADPPTHLWTRQLKFAGISNTSSIYKRGIRICTGTGLGASLSTCIQDKNWFLIWIGSDQAKTFGPTITSLIYKSIPPERMCLWDSKERGGRPDVVKLVATIYQEWQAEVVMITSNYQGNQELMEGLKQLGIPNFGTLWDF